ncbi:MAG: PEP-CTERM sorting domain-containing protein [Bryobacteraceae bacterium]
MFTEAPPLIALVATPIPPPPAEQPNVPNTPEPSTTLMSLVGLALFIGFSCLRRPRRLCCGARSPACRVRTLENPRYPPVLH